MRASRLIDAGFVLSDVDFLVSHIQALGRTYAGFLAARGCGLHTSRTGASSLYWCRLPRHTYAYFSAARPHGCRLLCRTDTGCRTDAGFFTHRRGLPCPTDAGFLAVQIWASLPHRCGLPLETIGKVAKGSNFWRALSFGIPSPVESTVLITLQLLTRSVLLEELAPGFFGVNDCQRSDQMILVGSAWLCPISNFWSWSDIGAPASDTHVDRGVTSIQRGSKPVKL